MIKRMFKSHVVDYPTPINLNYFWGFGSLAGFMLVVQIITGVFLGMHYTPHTEHAFASVEHIMRDVNYGWLIRYGHSNGASMFFLVVYLHIYRGIYYGSYNGSRHLLWVSGVVIFLLMIATAFMGYVLPWGQMSFWAATVITNLFSAIPIFGSSIVEWLWGGFSVDNATLNRFFSFHYLLPFVIAGLVLLHLALLHDEGSNNPLGVNVPEEKIPFYPYFYIKDLLGLNILMLVYSGFVFFAPNYLGHPDNYIAANPLVTPAHIVPEWYFLPFYAILRAVPNKLGGVILMVLAIVFLGLLPYISHTVVNSASFRPLYKLAVVTFATDCLILGWLGQKVVEYPYEQLSIVATIYYFFFFYLVRVISEIELEGIDNYTQHDNTFKERT